MDEGGGGGVGLGMRQENKGGFGRIAQKRRGGGANERRGEKTIKLFH